MAKSIMLPVSDDSALASAARVLLLDFVAYARAVGEIKADDKQATDLVDIYLSGGGDD